MSRREQESIVSCSPYRSAELLARLEQRYGYSAQDQFLRPPALITAAALMLFELNVHSDLSFEKILGPEVAPSAPPEVFEPLVDSWWEQLDSYVRQELGLPWNKVALLHDHHDLMHDSRWREKMDQRVTESGARPGFICPCCSPLSQEILQFTAELLSREIMRRVHEDPDKIVRPSACAISGRQVLCFTPKAIQPELDAHLRALGYDPGFAHDRASAAVHLASGQFKVLIVDGRLDVRESGFGSEVAHLVRSHLTLHTERSLIRINDAGRNPPPYLQGNYSQQGLDLLELGAEVRRLLGEPEHVH